MTDRITRWLSWPWLLRALVSHVRLTMRLLREPRVPPLVKAVPILGALYVVSPVDVIPDIVPILGQLDDLGVILLALETFLKWCPAPAVDFHRAALAHRRKYAPMPPAGDVIDAEFRRDQGSQGS